MYGYYGSGSDGWSGLWVIGMHVHFFFAALILVAFLGVLVWLFRFAKEAQLKKMIWASLLVGGVGALLTAPFAYWGMQNMMQTWYDRENGDDVSENDDQYRGMMDWWFDQYEKDQSDATTTTDPNL